MSRALISLGGNVGDVRAAMRRAVELLDSTAGTNVTAKSRFYATQPVGQHAGDRFVNSVVSLETDLLPESLLDRLQALESQLGRERTQHWGPRVIDLDLILYNQEIIFTDRLIVPHPACFYRRFVLDPAVEIASVWLHPTLGQTLSELKSKLEQYPIPVAFHTASNQQIKLPEMCERFRLIADADRHDAVLVVDEAGTHSAANAIPMPRGSNVESFLQQVYIAATDEPVPIGEF